MSNDLATQLLHPAYDEVIGGLSWQYLLHLGIVKMMHEIVSNGELNIIQHHVKETPHRFTNSLEEYLSGYKENPEAIIKAGFEELQYDQMVFVNDIAFISHCMHHIAPFAGKIHFAYIPDGRVVGLSKIPRLVDVLAHRLQIQEKLSDQIVDTFMKEIKPLGCGVVIEAIHFCICSRGVKKTGSYTRTTSLRGNFLHSPTKEEFLQGAKRLEGNLL